MDSGPDNAHLQHGSTGDGNAYGHMDFINGLQHYASGNSGEVEDMQQYLKFDDALFQSGTSQDFTTGLSQPSHQPHQAHQAQQQTSQHSYANAPYNQNASGRTASPALPAYGQQQHNFQHPQYPQQLYDQRSMYQYDPRLFQQRPAHSPAPHEQYAYPSNPGYASQTQQGQMNVHSRPNPSPVSQYAPRQQQYGQYITFDSRGPTLPQSQDTAELMQFANFQSHAQPTQSNAFVNPSLLNAEGGLGTGYGQLPQRQAQTQAQAPQQYYAKANSAIEQRPIPTQQMMGMGQTMNPAQMQGNNKSPLFWILADMEQPTQPSRYRTTPYPFQVSQNSSNLPRVQLLVSTALPASQTQIQILRLKTKILSLRLQSYQSIRPPMSELGPFILPYRLSGTLVTSPLLSRRSRTG
jgi:hypothetical protein